MAFENINTIKLLQNLLKESTGSSDSEDEPCSSAGVHKFGPGHINQRSNKKSQDNSNNYRDTLLESNTVNCNTDPIPKSIEEWEEIQEKIDEELLESRIRPNFKISYKQAIRTEDVYLQMANKTSATSSCENMIIDIDLPDETDTVDRMNLSVTKQSIDLKTSKYSLKIPLPQPIDPEKGKATWNADKKLFTLCLVLNREFDFVNF